MNTYLLSILIFLPLVAGLGVLAIPSAKSQIAKSISLLVASVTLLISLFIWSQMDPSKGFQFVEKAAWIPFMGIEYHVGVDGISLFLMILGALFTVLAMAYSWQNPDEALSQKAGPFFGLILIFESGILGTVLSLNLFQFYLFWELMLIPMYFLIGIWGGPNRIKAVTKFVVYTMVGSLVLLLSILYLSVQYQALTGNWSFDLMLLRQAQLPATPLVDLLFFGFALAFLIKLPLFPLHTWLPDTYCEAPPVVTFLLSGVMAKMGVYGLIRIPATLFPDAMMRWAPALSFLALVGIIYGAILALGQDQIKRLIAYSSISHLGLIALGVFSWNATSLEGVVYHMVNHAVATGGLFLLAGLLEQKGISKISQLGGFASQAPAYAVLFLLMTFSSIGVPGLNGFIGEFLILMGISAHSVLYAMGAALTLILSAAYMLWLTQRILFGESTGFQEKLRFNKGQLAALVPLSILAIVMGLYTQPFTRQISPAVQQNLTQPGPQHATESPWTMDQLA